MWILILWKEKHQNDKICYCKDAVWSSTKRDDILKVPCGAFQKQTNDVWVQCVYLKGLEKMLRTFVKLLRLFDLRGLFVTTLGGLQSLFVTVNATCALSPLKDHQQNSVKQSAALCIVKQENLSPHGAFNITPL